MLLKKILLLKQNQDVWNVHSVLNVLHALVSKSNINKQLEVLKHATLSLTITNPNGAIDQSQFTKYQQDLLLELENDLFAQSSLYKMLGYFSLVGLLRLNSLFDDYYLAINAMQYVELDIHKQVSDFFLFFSIYKWNENINATKLYVKTICMLNTYVS